MSTTTPTAPNPTITGAVISITIKAVLLALAALGWIPIGDDAIAEVTLATAAVADMLVYFGLVKPKVTQLQVAASGTTSS